jgi:uncharacterized C2H2 Zn-finger protein
MSANHPQNYLFRCDKCQFITSVKRDYQRHTLSAKHAKRTGMCAVSLKKPISEQMSQQDNSADLPTANSTFSTGDHPSQLAFIFDKQIYKTCEKCGSKYHSKSGLWKHRKTCQEVPVSTLPSPPVAPAAAPASVATTDQDFKTMMMELLKNNQEFQHKLIEMMCSQQSLAATAAAAASTAANAATAAATAAANAAAANATP